MSRTKVVTTVKLEPELKAQAANRAAREGISLGALVRAALRSFLDLSAEEILALEDPDLRPAVRRRRAQARARELLGR